MIGAAVILLIVVALIFGIRRDSERLSGTLNFWGVFDSPQIIGELVSQYQKLQPRVLINYRQINAATYENDLINALAGTQAPDIFMFHNAWLPKHFGKIVPLTDARISLSAFRGLYPTIVEQNFAPDGVIYALPLYIDTLALFYNKDAFDAKGIAAPPKNWLEFQNLIPKLRELDKTGRLAKMAAAIGGSNKSVNRASDILNLLMLQSGVPMTDKEFTRAVFADEGLESLNFYTQFSNARSPYYTWNDSLPFSVDSFSEGQTAMMFNYSHQIALLKEKNPFLNFTAAPMPQTSGAEKNVNYANYWGLAVSAKSQSYDAAWDFIMYLTANSDASRKYLQLTGKPPALRSLIAAMSDDPEIGMFTKQALTARSWPQIDNLAVENSFSKMIENVITGRLVPQKAIQQAEDEITALMSRRLR